MISFLVLCSNSDVQLLPENREPNQPDGCAVIKNKKSVLERPHP